MNLLKCRNLYRIPKTFIQQIRCQQTSAHQTGLTSSFNKNCIKDEFQVGAKHSGFQVVQVEDVSELQLTAIRLRHMSTGADYLHIARDDPNNVFCVGFRTTPMDSTGVPHILEHTVLCGSDKYPCRDPFFKMLNRSLSTFMNAMTGNDYTIYPFSTQHPTDFKNLMSVYLDSVFKPNLSELDFLQEGWRLEHSDISDKNSPIEFKGVVFNEMKGVFANSQNLFMQKLQNEVLPSHTYGVVSGGDPLTIPQLTWEHLRNFHASYYHPSNSRFYTYGDQNLHEHLSFIDSNYLQHYSSIEPQTEVPDEPTWNSPRTNHIECSSDPMSASDCQTSLAVTFKLSNVTDIYESFVLQILCELMFSGPNSHFYKSLIESQLGSSFSPASGYDGHTRDTTFTIGLQGMKHEHIDDVINVINDTFEKVSTEGIEQERIDATLHTIELGLKHQTTSFGLGLIMSLYPIWNQDGDPIHALEINQAINRFKQCLQSNPNYLQEKVSQYFLSNNHKFTLTMSPVDNYEEKLNLQEKQILEEKVDKLSDSEKQKIWDMGETLALKQNMEENIECLPTLQVSDIPRTVIPTTLTNINCNLVPIQICKQPTNGVTYFTALLNTKDIPAHLHSVVPIFTMILTKMGAGNLDYRQLDQMSDLKTGGLNASFHLSEHPANSNLYEEGILLSSHCLSHNFSDMMQLWVSIINELALSDVERFSTLIKMSAATKANGLVHNGHGYAMLSSASTLNKVASIKEQWSGISHLQELKLLSASENYDQILDKLRELSKLVLNKKSIRIAINLSPEDHDSTIKEMESFLSSLDGSPSESDFYQSSDNVSLEPCSVHHVLPFPINFASKAFSCQPYAHEDTGPLRLASRLMFKFLHREIREKGGAYGGGATMNPGGAFTFYSYRDPNSVQTLDTFDAAVDWILQEKFSEQDLAEAKLGIFQKIDAPVSPGNKGLRHFLSHIDDEMLIKHRQSILDCDCDSLIKVTNKYLNKSVSHGCSLIGPENDLLRNNNLWKTITY